MGEFDQVMFPEIEQYANAHTTEVSSVLKELERETYLKTISPRMLSGKLQGQFLQQICLIKQPLQVLEIGTFTGYSAISMALALRPEAHLTTIEANPEREEMINEYFQKAQVKHQVTLKIGDAKILIPELNNHFDLVFLDADKVNYPLYYNLLMPKLNIGGILIADNVLWSGKVLGASSDKEVKALQAFNDMVQADDKVHNVLLPFRDGLLMAIKIKD